MTVDHGYLHTRGSHQHCRRALIQTCGTYGREPDNSLPSQGKGRHDDHIRHRVSAHTTAPPTSSECTHHHTHTHMNTSSHTHTCKTRVAQSTPTEQSTASTTRILFSKKKRISHALHMESSCHAYEDVMLHTWRLMSHNVYQDSRARHRKTNHPPQKKKNESCLIYGVVVSNI